MTQHHQVHRSSTRRPLLWLRALLIGLLVTSGTIVVSAGPAQAASPGNILPPFAAGETWKIYQGYGPNAYSHHNGAGNPPSLYGLDLTHGGSDTSSAGKIVKAPISGNATYSSGSGTLCINTPGNGPSVALTHINASVSNGAVNAGDTVGTVASAGQKQNGGVAHIHLQMWSTNGCWSTGNGGVPFDSAHNARICGAPNLTATGGGGTNGVWSGTTFTGDTCGSTAPPLPPGDGVHHIFSGTSTGSISETYWGGGNALTSSQVAHVGSAAKSLEFTRTPDSVNHIFTGTSDGQVYETYWGGGNALTNYAMAPLNGAAGSLDYARTADGVNHVFTGTVNGDIYETYFGGGHVLTNYVMANVSGAVTDLQFTTT